MYGLFNGGAPDSVTGSARQLLTSVMESVGASGLAAAATRPRLLAAVDQHTAAISDSLSDARSTVSGAALAGYAEGVREAAAGHGWQPPAVPIDWSEPDWVLTRLLAVCALARGEGFPVNAVSPPAGGGPASA